MKTIVLLHGWGMSPAVFDEIADELAERSGVSRPALAGYGCSPAPSPYTVEQLVAEVSASAPAQCHAVGWSLGAHVALHWARAKPKQVERLALIAATPSFVRRADWREAIDESVVRSFGDDLASDTEGVLTRFTLLQAQGDASAKTITRKLRHALVKNASSRAAALQGGLTILEEEDLRAVLPEVPQRTLLVQGENDQLVPLAAAKYLAGALPHARLETIAGAAHAPFLSSPRSVARLLSDHFDER